MHPRALRAICCAALLPALTGCGALKGIVQNAHATLHSLGERAVQAEEAEAEVLYAMEDRILERCGSLLGGARLRVSGEPIPFGQQLAALVTSGSCDRTVARTRRQLAARSD